MLIDETFWVAFSTILIMTIAFKYAKQPLKSALNNRSASISNKIAEAMSLLGEAEKLLKEQKEFHEFYLKEVDNTLKSIDTEIDRLRKQAEANYVLRLHNKNNALTDRIYYRETKLLSKLRLESVQLAIATVIIALRKQENSEITNKILDDSMQAIMLKQI